MRKRVFLNPAIGDKPTLTTSVEETNSEFTLFQIEMILAAAMRPTLMKTTLKNLK